MSKFGSFLEYLDLDAAGKLAADHTYKNYDLTYLAGNRRLKKALAECDFRQSELYIALSDCWQRVGERGYRLTIATIRECLLEWYVWHRINSGEYRTWKYR